MNEFKEYRRKGAAQMRPWQPGDDMSAVSVSVADKDRGSPTTGDMIARNPENHADVWLVSAKYFQENFEVGAIVGKDDLLFGYNLQ